MTILNYHPGLHYQSSLKGAPGLLSAPWTHQAKQPEGEQYMQADRVMGSNITLT